MEDDQIIGRHLRELDLRGVAFRYWHDGYARKIEVRLRSGAPIVVTRTTLQEVLGAAVGEVLQRAATAQKGYEEWYAALRDSPNHEIRFHPSEFSVALFSALRRRANQDGQRLYRRTCLEDGRRVVVVTLSPRRRDGSRPRSGG